MSINTGALFDRARALVDSAVDSSGTRVTFYTQTSNGLADPTETIIRQSPAIQTVVGATNAREEVAGVLIMPTDWKIVCKAKTPIPPDGSYLRIEKTKSTHMIGAVAKLIGVKTDSSGAHVTLFYRPQR